MKKFLGVLTAILLCSVILVGLLPQEREYRIAKGNHINFGQLLTDLLDAYEKPSPESEKNIEFDLSTIRAVSSKDFEVAESIAEHWSRVYLDPDYRLNVDQGGRAAPELLTSGIPDSRTHAFVVLGYELRDGEMTDELKGRCDAAAAAAREFPNTILVCSGGATGANNPEHHTEAGMMKDYLVEHCGIAEERIFTDERAMTTAENAVNTFAILKAENVRTLTVVTSDYHQRWGQVLYNAMAALYKQQYGSDFSIISNCCFQVEPENEKYRNDAGIAVQQLGQILGIPSEAMR